MNDSYGLPASVRGGLGDDWFALTGRLVIVTSLVEYQVLKLCASITQTDMKIIGTQHFGKVHKTCQSAVQALATDNKKVLNDWLDEVQLVRAYRHDIVHSHWPHETFGWRSPMSTKDEIRLGDDGLIKVRTDLNELRSMVGRAAQIVQRGNEMAARAQLIIL
jgi:hypothetical protein